MPRTFRVGVIGHTGRGDYGHAVDVACRRAPNVEIVAVADPVEAGRQRAQERTGARTAYAAYRDMLAKEKPDVVAICPRHLDQHHEMLMAAAEAGCHVYMEKPFCRTPAEADAVVRAFEMRHLKLGIAHISQYSPVLAAVNRAADADIGDLLEIRGRGKEDARGGGEDLWVLGSHVFGLMRSIAGGNATSCYATVTQGGEPVAKRHVREGAEGIGPLAGDHVQAQYSFPRGITGYFASRKGMAGQPTRFAVQVFGSKGVIELESGYGVKADLLRDSSWSPGRTKKTWEVITSAGIGRPEPHRRQLRGRPRRGDHGPAGRDREGPRHEVRVPRRGGDRRDDRGRVRVAPAGPPAELPLQSRANPPRTLLT